MKKYEFDAVRYCQANMDRMGVMPTGQAVGALIIGEINALRAENDTLRNEARVYREQCAMRDEWRDKIEGELAALRDAARPIAQFWKGCGVQGVVRGTNPPLEEKHLDALAALVGEE